MIYITFCIDAYMLIYIYINSFYFIIIIIIIILSSDGFKDTH